MPATIVASRSEIRATADERGAHPQRDLSRERSEGGQVQERVHHGGGEQCAGAQHRVAEHDAQAGERQCVERVTDLRDVAGEQREHDSRGEEGNDAGTHAPILGVAPVAPGQGRARGPDEDQHRQPIDKLLTECAQGQAERLVRPSDVRGVLEHPEQQRHAAHEEELAPRKEVGPVETQPAGADHRHEQQAERDRR